MLKAPERHYRIFSCMKLMRLRNAGIVYTVVSTLTLVSYCHYTETVAVFFFLKSITPKPNINILKYFRILLRIH
jgi:hypothetical protein